MILNNLLLYGGSFDPIHNGHLKTLQIIQKNFSFDQVYLLPCQSQPLKNTDPIASATHRLAMIKLGLASIDADTTYHVDDCELNRSSPSYTVLTLEAYRQKYPEMALTFLMGQDSFLTIPQWHQWEKLFALANLLVMARTADPLPQTRPIETDRNKFMQTKQGSIYYVDAGFYPISSSEIRKKCQKRQSIEADLPPSVAQYIDKHGLYRHEI